MLTAMVNVSYCDYFVQIKKGLVTLFSLDYHEYFISILKFAGINAAR